MRLAIYLLALLLGAGGAVAQQDVAVPVDHADGAVLRGLDTMTGKLVDIPIARGETRRFERLEITLGDCRYPVENPGSDAYAYLTIRDIREDKPRFEGWMVASSPALSALDHPRYDVWVLRCNIPAAEASTGD